MTTRILMSFGMADGGMMFVQWLRNRLMKDYGLFSTNSVYVDFVTARAGNCVYGVKPEAAPPHYAAVNLDGGEGREHMLSATKARPIGAMHPDWKEMFDGAMGEAEVVIFVVNKAFQASKWCMQELDGFRLLLARKPKLRGVVLDVDDSGFRAAAHGLPIGRMSIIRGGREAREGGMLWDRGLWAISEGAYMALTRAIGDHPEWREG